MTILQDGRVWQRLVRATLLAAFVIATPSCTPHTAHTPMPVLAMVVIFHGVAEVVDSVAEHGDASLILRLKGQPFAASAFRHELAPIFGIPSDQFKTRYGLMLTTSTAEPHREATRSGDGFCIALAAAGERVEVRLCVSSKTHAWHSAFHSTLAPEDVLVTPISLDGELYLLVAHVELLRTEDASMPARYRRMQEEFTEDLKAETDGTPFAMTTGTMDAAVRECIGSH